MNILQAFDELLNGTDATATVATGATDTGQKGQCVASVASVIVANCPNPKTDEPVLAAPTPAEPESKPPLYLLFASKGFDDATAQALLDAVAARDARFADDRRLCAECTSWMLDRCRKRITPIGQMTPYTLHRCHGFELEVIPT